MIAGLQAHLNQVRAWVKNKPNLTVCDIEYHALLREPRATAEAVQSYLERRLDTEAMAGQVDLSLFRNRSAAYQQQPQ